MNETTDTRDDTAGEAGTGCPLSDEARQYLPWMQLFQGGAYEVVLLTVGQLDPDHWQQARDELVSLDLLRTETEVQIGNRPYLRFDPALEALAADAPPLDPEEVRPQFIGAYTALDLAVRQALKGSSPQKGVKVLTGEEANYRQAVQWAVESGDHAIARVLGGTFADYLSRCGRPSDREIWQKWLDEALAENPAVGDASAGDTG